MREWVWVLLLTVLLGKSVAFGETPSVALPRHDFSRYHFVLVGGLNNELRPRYFAAFDRFLRENGADSVTPYMPQSTKTVTENIPYLKAALLCLFRVSEKPLFILAHSKGALETLNAVLRSPRDFPPEVIGKMVFANGPFLGSPNTVRAIEKFKALWGWNPFNPFYQTSLRVFESLQTEVITRALNESARGLTPGQSVSLSDRTFFFRTEKEAEQVDPELRDSAEYLRQFGPNDGFIPTENQKLKAFAGLAQFGNDLGIVRDVDHRDLFVHDRRSASTQAEIFTWMFDRIAGIERR